MEKMLKNKVIVVTGGAGLLGSLFVESLVDAEANVLIADLNDKKATNLVNQINKKTGRVCTSFVAMNITKIEEIRNAISYCKEIFGKIDGLVNSAYPANAMYGRKVEDVSYESFCENVNMHLGGYFLVSREFANYFRLSGGGSIVTMSSIYGMMAPRFEVYEGTTMTMPVEYAAIKAGLMHLMRYFAKYYAGKNIRFNCISPGGIAANQPETFLKRYSEHCLNKGMLDGKDICGTLKFLLSDESIYINGQNITVDDGYSL